MRANTSTSVGARNGKRHRDPFELILFSQLEPTERELAFLLDGPFPLPPGDLTMLYGDSGIGKSWLVYQVLVAVATGKVFLDRKPQRAPVMLLDFENRPAEVWRRIAQVARAGGTDTKDLDGWVHVLSLAPTGSGLTESIEKVMDKVEEAQPGLIIVDGWLAAFGGDLVGSDVINDALRKLRRLQGDDRSVLVLHHVSTSGKRAAPKGAAPDPAGNRFVRHGCRVVLNLAETTESGPFTLKVVKENYGLSKEPTYLKRIESKDMVIFELATEGFRIDVSDVSAPSPNSPNFDWNGLVLEQVRQSGGKAYFPNVKKMIQKMQGKSERTARRLLNTCTDELAAAGLLTLPADGNTKWLCLSGVAETVADMEVDTLELAAD